jgi:hypothetical protein
MPVPDRGLAQDAGQVVAQLVVLVVGVVGVDADDLADLDVGDDPRPPR